MTKPKHLKHFIHYRYLTQLIVTCLVFLIIPFILMLYIMMHHSYQELQTENHEFYLSATRNYSSDFLAELDSLLTVTNRISVDSRSSDTPAYALNTNRLELNPYYFAEGCDSISFYRNNSSRTLAGIYYPDRDWLITDSYKYTARSYATNYLQISDQTIIDELCSFLTDSSDQKMRMYSLFSKQEQTKCLLLAIPTYVRYNKSPVLMLYRLDESFLEDSHPSSAAAATFQFCVFAGDSGELLLSSGSKNIDLTASPFALDPTEMASGKVYTLEQDGREYTCFLTYSKPMNYYYGIICPYDEIHRASLNYFDTMKTVMWATIAALLVLLPTLIYINYKPIHVLLSKVPRRPGIGELDTIASAIDNITDELNELNLLLKDYILENILRGKPINESLLHRIGLTEHDGHFQVYAVSTHTGLITAERTALTREILDRFAVRALITDILMQNITIIVCLIPQNGGAGMTEYLQSWFSEHHPDETLCVGTVVDSINELQQSYLSSGIRNQENTKNQRRQEAKNAQLAEKSAQLSQDILQYLQQNFCDPNLSQTTVADHFQISTYTLSRLFKSQFGIGFTEFISSQRMEAAKQLLLTTDAPIGEIAAQVGLPNLNYFSRLFKSTYGASPSQYRSMN
ncbi:MAG: helix-turn-helix transcriptional regulator [Lachnospiraceae bacterium]|nr:helix-turn-helix transcriptional regulator [Lachnospiraceae bacterium]